MEDTTNPKMKRMYSVNGQQTTSEEYFVYRFEEIKAQALQLADRFVPLEVRLTQQINRLSDGLQAIISVLQPLEARVVRLEAKLQAKDSDSAKEA